MHITDDPYFTYSILAAIMGFYFSRHWNPNATKINHRNSTCKSSCKRGIALYLCWLIFITLQVNSALYTWKVEGTNGESILLKDSINNMIKSPMWKKFWGTMYILYQRANEKGWKNTWNEFQKKLDPDGLRRASKELGFEYDDIVKKKYSINSIRATRNKLALKWHPDKQDTTNTKEIKKASTKFAKIQEAYEIIAKYYKKSKKKKKKKELGIGIISIFF